MERGAVHTVSDFPDYQAIIQEMKTKLRRGFRPRRSRESEAVYEVQCESFYRSCWGMIFMCEAELGKRQIKVTKANRLLLN